MIITETIRRQCCAPQDLKKVGTAERYGVPCKVRCKHCKQLYELTRFTDAAGSSDWDYKPVKSK